MSATGQYDPDVHMYREAKREPDVAVLRFLRWLAERGRLEHDVVGVPAGEWARSWQARVAH